MKYLTFLFANWRFLCFGAALQLFASPGHTYYISILATELRREFDLSHADFGLLFALATLAGGASLIYLGRLIDRLDLRLFSALACIWMAGAALLTSAAANVLMLAFGIYALRLGGQGLMAHTAAISMARYYPERRGTAISISSLGSTAGLSLFPTIGVMLLATVGWRLGFMSVGLVYAAFVVPLVLWLLKGHGERHRRYLEFHTGGGAPPSGVVDVSLGDVLRDIRFYLILPMLTAPAYILTGFVFMQVFIVESKGWSLPAFAAGFVGFAGASLLFSLILGPLIDRVSALRVMPFILAPLAVVLPILALYDHPIVAWIFLIGMGACLGGVITVFGAIWAEIWGTGHLGAIRSVGQALSVFATALAPWVFGLMVDDGVGVAGLAWVSLAHVVIASLLAFLPWFARPGVRADG
ncbi:MAG: MFS transporter [Rhodospirillales bacterium]|nr:MFS transporter [Rhodospirillales bacterium]MDP6644481.1 MFS transporter [Rhodospirillales bacterium]MDP6840208.1 MFS transporter [Rhodospirillales bacterium]